MDLWLKARSLAEEAAKRSQELTIGTTKISDIVSETAKRSKEIASETAKRSKEIASETAKRSKEIAVEASKRADQIKIEALKGADKIKLLADGISPSVRSSPETEASDLEKFGVTDELREFVKGITMNTFQDFPLEDDTEMSDVPTVSNVRQDLTQWQERHANLVLSTVKEVSKLRYELCPRFMKERKFWRIYFILVNSHVAPYEKQYMEDVKLKSAEEEKEDDVKEIPKAGTTVKVEAKESNKQSRTSTSSATEQDLDVFLLGDLGDSDEGPDDGDEGYGDEGFDDDFDKIVNSSDDEKEKL